MNRLKLLLVGMMLAAVLPVVAQTTTYYSNATGNWNLASSWSTVGFGAGTNTGTFPVAGDIVNIGAGHTISITANQACASITFDVGATATSTLEFDGAFTLAVSGDITIPRPSTASILNRFNVNDGILTVSSILFSNAATGLGGHQINITSGSLTVTGNISNTAGSGSSPAIAITDAGMLRLGGALFTSAQGTLSTGAGSTVEYNGSVAQVIPAFSIGGNLVLSGGGAKSFEIVIPLSIQGNLVIGNLTTLTIGGLGLTVEGATTIGGGSSGGITINGSNGTKIFKGLVTINTGAEWKETVNENFDFQGGIYNDGTFTAYTLAALPAIHSFSINSQTITGIFSIPRVSISNSITLTVNGSLTSSYAVTLSAGSSSLINEGTMSIRYLNITGANANLTSNGIATIIDSVALVQGTSRIFNTGDLTISGKTIGSGAITATTSGNTVNYSGANQSIFPGSYHHFDLSGSGVKTLPSTTLNISGDLQISGTTTVSGASTTLNFNGTTQNITGTTTLLVANIQLSGSGVKTFGAPITVSSGLTIGGGTIAGFSSSNLYSANSLMINGGFQAAGTYGSEASVATNKSDNFFSGDGIITINTGTIRTYYSIAPTDWSLPTTWSTVGFGYNENFGSNPVAGDLVVIGNNVTVTMGASHACALISFDNTTTGTSSLNLSDGELTVTTITIARPTSGAGTNLLDVGTGTLHATDVTYTNGGSGIHRLAIGLGTANISGTVTGSGISSEFLFTDAGNLNLQGTFFSTGTFTSATGSTVTYMGGVQSVRPVTYYNLVLSGGVKSSVAGTTTVNGNLTIADDASFTLGSANLAVFGNTMVGSGTGGTLSFTSIDGVKLFGGLVTLNAGSTWSATTESFSFSGGLLNTGGTFNAGTGTYVFNTNSQSITGISSIPNLTFSTPGILVTLTINGNFTTDNLVINGASHSIANNGTLTINSTISGTGSIIQKSGSILNTVATGTLSNGISALSETNHTVNYLGSAQTVLGGNYYHLNLSGSGVKSLQSTTTAIAGDFTMADATSTSAVSGITFSGGVSIGASATFNLGYLNHSVLGNWASAGTVSSTGSLVSFDGADQSISNSTNSNFYNLSLLGTGTKTFLTKVDINGTMTVSSEVVVNLGTFTDHETSTLVMGGTVKLLGTHGSSSSAAATPDDVFFAPTTGYITVNALVYFSRDNGNWNSNSTWSNSDYSGSAASSTPSGSAVVFIGGGHTVTATADASCSALTFQQGTTEDDSLKINSGITVTVAGSITIPRQTSGIGSSVISVGSGNLTTGNVDFTTAGGAGVQRINISTGTLRVNGNVSGIGSSSTIEFTGAGLFRLFGTMFTAGFGTLTMNSASTMEFAGGTQVVTNRSYGGNLLISGSGTKTWTLNPSRTIPGNLVVNSGNTLTISSDWDFTVSGQTTISGSINLGGNDAIKTFTGDVTVNSGGTWSETTFGQVNFGGSFNFNGNSYTAGIGEHVFSGTSETIGGAGKTLSIPNVTVNGTYSSLGTLTISTALTGTGTLTMGPSSSLNIGGSSTLATLNASASGTTVNYSGTGAQTVLVPTDGLYQNLSFNNTTATGLATLASPGATLSIGGNWTNNGTTDVGGFRGFNPNSGTVVFNGTTQTMGGSAPTMFNKLVINASTSVDFQSNAIVNGDLDMLTGTLNNNGVLTLGNNVTINRNAAATYTGAAPVSGTPPLGNHYNLTYSGTGTINTGPEAQGSHVKDVNIELTGTLTQANTMDLYGIMLVNSGATYDPGDSLLTVKSFSDTGIDAGGSIGTISGAFLSNPIHVERYFRAVDNKDRFFSSPVTSASVDQLQDAFPVTGKFVGTSYPCTGCLNNGYSLRWYKESTPGILNIGYRGYPSTDSSAVLTPGVGYDAWMWHGITPDTITFTGPINQGSIGGLGTDVATGQVVSRTANGVSNADGWNLIGNPYPAPIRWTGDNSGGWTLTNIEGQAWAWDVFTATWVPINDGSDIAIGQAIWVRVPLGETSGTINITEAAKSSARSGAYHREQATKPTLKINLSNGSITENAFIVVRDGASVSYNWKVDFSKIEIGQESMHLTLVKDDQHLGYYAYQSNMEADIPIRMVAEEEGLYELSFEELGGFPSLTGYFLFDVITQERVAFRPTLRYTFTYTKKDPQQRFILTKKGGELLGNQHLVQVYPNPTSGMVSLAINSAEPVQEVSLLNTAGQVLLVKPMLEQNGQQEISLLDYPSGVYLLKVKLPSGVVIKRIIKN